MGSRSLSRDSQIHEPTPDTPYHARRRDEIRTRATGYGIPKIFIRPAPEPEHCSKCDKNLSYSQDFIRINGSAICGSCLADACN